MLSNRGTFAVSDCLSLLTGLLTHGNSAQIIIIIIESPFGNIQYTAYIGTYFYLNGKMKAVVSSDGSHRYYYYFYAQISLPFLHTGLITAP